MASLLIIINLSMTKHYCFIKIVIYLYLNIYMYSYIT